MTEYIPSVRSRPPIQSTAEELSGWSEPFGVDNIIPSDSWIPIGQCGTKALQIVSYTESTSVTIKTLDVTGVFRVSSVSDSSTMTKDLQGAQRQDGVQFFKIGIGSETGVECASSFTHTSTLSGNFYAACFVGFDQAFPSRFYECEMTFEPESHQYPGRVPVVVKHPQCLLPEFRATYKRVQKALAKYDRKILYTLCVGGHDTKFDLKSCSKYFKTYVYDRLYDNARSEHKKLIMALVSTVVQTLELLSDKTQGGIIHDKTQRGPSKGGISLNTNTVRTDKLLTDLIQASKIATMLTEISREAQSQSDSHAHTGIDESVPVQCSEMSSGDYTDNIAYE